MSIVANLSPNPPSNLETATTVLLKISIEQTGSTSATARYSGNTCSANYSQSVNIVFNYAHEQWQFIQSMAHARVKQSN